MFIYKYYDTAENEPRQVCCMITARELWFWNRSRRKVKRKMAARYFRFSPCFEFITSSNLSHVGPCCVLGHFQLSKNNDAFSVVHSRPGIWRCLVFSELLFQSVAPKKNLWSSAKSSELDQTESWRALLGTKSLFVETSGGPSLKYAPVFLMQRVG